VLPSVLAIDVALMLIPLLADEAEPALEAVIPAAPVALEAALPALVLAAPASLPALLVTSLIAPAAVASPPNPE